MKKAAVGICIKDGKVLLLRKAEDASRWAGYFCFPGGHLDKGETFEQALQREYTEETGRRLLSWKLLGEHNIEKKVIKIFLVQDDEAPIKISDEHDNYTIISVNHALDVLPLGDMTRKFLEMVNNDLR